MNNLPIPQSRSEELMNAFIQRDSSQISTPQSRIEEFWYHLIEGTNSLPIPQSRNELLLKKIIENDTHQIPLAQSRTEEFLVSILTGDINKLPIPQSRSEYYLDYIARNNLLLNDIDYVRYSGTNITATNTVQKPFRSAILKGQTLVNVTKFIRNANSGGSNYARYYSKDMLKKNTKYLCIWNAPSYVRAINLYTLNGGFIFQPYKETKRKFIITTNDTDDWGEFTPHFYPNDETGKIPPTDLDKFSLMLIEYQEGMENWDIPYFEGMQSVKMPVLTTTGKNLFNGEYEGGAIVSDGFKYETSGTRTTMWIPCKPNTTYVCNSPSRNRWLLRNSYGVETFVGGRVGDETPTVTTLSDTTHLRCYYLRAGDSISFDLQIEEGSVSTSYEPYKTNILTVNEDVTLRSNGNICDELNLLTGQLTQRIDEDGEVLSQEVVKTVDLKVVNQDGNQVKELSAFDGTTHIVSGSASDNSLIAITEVEVPTKLIEVLDGVKSLSSDVEILINEVDNTQKLQDENSTMAMSAMTELYEMILMMGGND